MVYHHYRIAIVMYGAEITGVYHLRDEATEKREYVILHHDDMEISVSKTVTIEDAGGVVLEDLEAARENAEEAEAKFAKFVASLPTTRAAIEGTPAELGSIGNVGEQWGDRNDAAVRRLHAKGIPIYCSTNEDDIPEGLYLSLFHGFVNEEDRAEAQDWGSYGPMIGPLRYFQTTYNCNARFEFANEPNSTAKLYGFEPETGITIEELGLDAKEGTITYDDHEYGDWTLHAVIHTKT